jgi:hypothetical protein
MALAVLMTTARTEPSAGWRKCKPFSRRRSPMQREEDPALLEPIGGVGAFLRWRA